MQCADRTVEKTVENLHNCHVLQTLGNTFPGRGREASGAPDGNDPDLGGKDLPPEGGCPDRRDLVIFWPPSLDLER